MCRLRNHFFRCHGSKSLRPQVLKMPQTYKHTNWPWFIYKSHALGGVLKSVIISLTISTSRTQGFTDQILWNLDQKKIENSWIDSNKDQIFSFLTHGSISTDQSTVDSVGDIFNKSVRGVIGPINSCAKMWQSFRWQKMIMLIVFSILDLV